jgi:hypothetical protein
MAVDKRRGKRDKQGVGCTSNATKTYNSTRKNLKKNSAATSEHSKSGVEALLPSAICLVVFGFAVMAKLGFRGRISVVGIDLGTTNSVVCIQALSSSGTSVEEIRSVYWFLHFFQCFILIVVGS